MRIPLSHTSVLFLIRVARVFTSPHFWGKLRQYVASVPPSPGSDIATTGKTLAVPAVSGFLECYPLPARYIYTDNRFAPAADLPYLVVSLWE